jgi:hypothetical protein
VGAQLHHSLTWQARKRGQGARAAKKVPGAAHHIASFKDELFEICVICVICGFLPENFLKLSFESQPASLPENFLSSNVEWQLVIVAALTRLSDQSDPVPDNIWNNAAEHYDDKGLAALQLSIAGTNVFNRLNVATRQVAGEWLKSAAWS